MIKLKSTDVDLLDLSGYVWETPPEPEPEPPEPQPTLSAPPAPKPSSSSDPQDSSDKEPDDDSSGDVEPTDNKPDGDASGAGELDVEDQDGEEDSDSDDEDGVEPPPGPPVQNDIGDPDLGGDSGDKSDELGGDSPAPTDDETKSSDPVPGDSGDSDDEIDSDGDGSAPGEGDGDSETDPDSSLPDVGQNKGGSPSVPGAENPEDSDDNGKSSDLLDDMMGGGSGGQDGQGEGDGSDSGSNLNTPNNNPNSAMAPGTETLNRRDENVFGSNAPDMKPKDPSTSSDDGDGTGEPDDDEDVDFGSSSDDYTDADAEVDAIRDQFDEYPEEEDLDDILNNLKSNTSDIQSAIEDGKTSISSPGNAGGGASGMSLMDNPRDVLFTAIMKHADRWVKDLKGKAGVNLVYSTDTLSRRVKGLFGREIDSVSNAKKELDKVLIVIYDTSGSMDRVLMSKVSTSLFYKLTREKIVKEVAPFHFDGKISTEFLKLNALKPKITGMLKVSSGSYIQPAYRQIQKILSEKRNIKVSGIIIISDFDIFDLLTPPEELQKMLKDVPTLCIQTSSASYKLEARKGLWAKWKRSIFGKTTTFISFDGKRVDLFARNGLDMTGSVK